MSIFFLKKAWIREVLVRDKKKVRDGVRGGFFFKKKMLGFVRYWFVTKKKVRDGVRESEFGSEFVDG